VATCQRVAFGLLREREIRPDSVLLSSSLGDHDEMVTYAIRLDAPIAEVMALDEELGRRLFEAWPDLHLHRFWMGFEREHAA
jgi:hypothetical protein